MQDNGQSCTRIQYLLIVSFAFYVRDCSMCTCAFILISLRLRPIHHQGLKLCTLAFLPVASLNMGL